MKKDIKIIKAKILNNEPLTSEEKKAFILYALCVNHGGKMAGINSLSTSCLENPYCQARHKNKKLVCHECYSFAQLEYRKNNAEKLFFNYLFFNNYELTKEDIPYINDNIFRVEAFGDAASVTAVNNYYMFAKKNKHCTFAAWTKNLDLYALAGAKPKNFILVYSIPEINRLEATTKAFFDLIKRQYPFVDKIFAVFTKDFAHDHGIVINCGGKNCLPCQICYHKNRGYRKNIICEILK